MEVICNKAGHLRDVAMLACTSKSMRYLSNTSTSKLRGVLVRTLQTECEGVIGRRYQFEAAQVQFLSEALPKVRHAGDAANELREISNLHGRVCVLCALPCGGYTSGLMDLPCHAHCAVATRRYGESKNARVRSWSVHQGGAAALISRAVLQHPLACVIGVNFKRTPEVSEPFVTKVLLDFAEQVLGERLELPDRRAITRALTCQGGSLSPHAHALRNKVQRQWDLNTAMGDEIADAGGRVRTVALKCVQHMVTAVVEFLRVHAVVAQPTGGQKRKIASLRDSIQDRDAIIKKLRAELRRRDVAINKLRVSETH